MANEGGWRISPDFAVVVPLQKDLKIYNFFPSRRSSGGPPVQVLGSEGGGQGQSSKGKVMWPEMGTLEWLVCKQVRMVEVGGERGGRERE